MLAVAPAQGERRQNYLGAVPKITCTSFSARPCIFVTIMLDIKSNINNNNETIIRWLSMG
jgi:hypothetical protein